MAIYNPDSNQHSDGSDTVCSPKKRKSTKPNKPTLDELLESVQVDAPGMWENGVSHLLDGWYAVSNDDGIIAYFGNEVDAMRFRLDYINRILNP